MKNISQKTSENKREAARQRGIGRRDRVKVLNYRGVVEVQVKVTPRIVPGVLSLPQGAWYQPDNKGVGSPLGAVRNAEEM